jgi:hypothetical protein
MSITVTPPSQTRFIDKGPLYGIKCHNCGHQHGYYRHEGKPENCPKCKVDNGFISRTCVKCEQVNTFRQKDLEPTNANGKPNKRLLTGCQCCGNPIDIKPQDYTIDFFEFEQELKRAA